MLNSVSQRTCVEAGEYIPSCDEVTKLRAILSSRPYRRSSISFVQRKPIFSKDLQAARVTSAGTNGANFKAGPINSMFSSPNTLTKRNCILLHPIFKPIASVPRMKDIYSPNPSLMKTDWKRSAKQVASMALACTKDWTPVSIALLSDAMDLTRWEMAMRFMCLSLDRLAISAAARASMACRRKSC